MWSVLFPGFFSVPRSFSLFRYSRINPLYFLRSFPNTLLFTLRRTISRDFCEVPCMAACMSA